MLMTYVSKNRKSICITTILLIFIIIIISLLLYHEHEHFCYLINLNENKNDAGYPTKKVIRQYLLSHIQQINMYDYILIDFGCGFGDIIDHFHTSFSNVIGVEIHAEQAALARERFVEKPSIEICTMDMCDYRFRNTPFTLFMHEPLWQLEREEAHGIYHKVFQNMVQYTNCDAYVIYISGVCAKLDDMFFKMYKFETIHHCRINRFLGWKANHIYICRRIMDSTIVHDRELHFVSPMPF